MNGINGDVNLTILYIPFILFIPVKSHSKEVKL